MCPRMTCNNCAYMYEFPMFLLITPFMNCTISGSPLAILLMSSTCIIGYTSLTNEVQTSFEILLHIGHCFWTLFCLFGGPLAWPCWPSSFSSPSAIVNTIYMKLCTLSGLLLGTFLTPQLKKTCICILQLFLTFQN